MDVSAISSAFPPSATNQPLGTETLTPHERALAAHLRGAALRKASPAEQRAAVSSQFEAIFVRQLLGKTMTSMLGSGGGASANVYGDLLTDTFAQQLTAGSGIGVAKMIEQQLAPRSTKRPDGDLPTR